MADSIIEACSQFADEKVDKKSNYHDTYIEEILLMIDERLQNNQELKTGIEFEVSLKQHICGFAARKFQKMHEDFIQENDPYRCLLQNKEKFRADFKDVFNERDQCQKKAEEFTNSCLKPAVEYFVNRSLGPDIIGEMQTHYEFKARMYFQYSVLLDLISKDTFENYLSYICSYEDHINEWILNKIMDHFSDPSTVFEFEDRHIQSSIKNINNAMKKAKTGKSGNLKTFVEDICKELGDKLVISQDALGAFMILNNADQEQFAYWLIECVKEMAQTLREKLKNSNIEKKLKKLHLKPQNELFTKLIGCGKQCPFCKAPCEAGGNQHTEHWTSLHRPKGMGSSCFSKKLDTDVCSSLVISDRLFRRDIADQANMKLFKEFNKWELELEKDMYTWVTNSEIRISNFGKFDVKTGIPDMKVLLTCLKSEAWKLLSEWETKLLENLTQYFKQTEGHVYLDEGHKEVLANNAKSLRREIERSVFNRITAAAEIKQGMAELERVKKNHTEELEGRVCALVEKCRKKNVKMTDTELDQEFEKMWNETVDALSFSKQKATDVFTNVSYYLRANISHKGSHACQLLSQKSLQECGLESFKYKAMSIIEKIKEQMNYLYRNKQSIADSVIAACSQFLSETMARKSNYHDTYIQEILHMIDERLLNNQDIRPSIDFEVSLKQHICGLAARMFQKMHEDFIEENDPYRCLLQNKEKFCADFRDVFNERDQCQKKAEEFTNRCLKPAVEDFVNRSLGLDIIGEMLTCPLFSTRIFFQHSILLDLLSNDDFENDMSYNCSYEDYLKKWMLSQITEHFSDPSKAFKIQNHYLQSGINSINKAINKAKTGKSGNLKTFVEDICKELGEKLVISQDALGAFMILNNADQEQFAYWLTECVKEMAHALREEFKKTNIEITLKHLHEKPQNELFNRLIGCGKQCPFCKAPCEAAGKNHTQHWTFLHLSTGQEKYRSIVSVNNLTYISSHIISDECLPCKTKKGKWHPYKHYKEIFPDWIIAPDVSLHASDYWKYVMAKFNNEFAKEYNAKPADIPSDWKNITPEQAKTSLKESFNIK